MLKDLYRKGVSISEIARQTGHDRKTIRAAVSAPLHIEGPKRGLRARKIDEYVGYLHGRMAEGVLNAHKLFMEIQAQGYRGGESQVKAYVHPYRIARLTAATVRFETEPGEQAQVDWGHFGYIDYAGQRGRLYGFAMTLGWSRAMYVEFTTVADSARFLRCHVHGFEYLGGVPEQIVHDNLKSAVVSRDADGTIHWNARYLDFASVLGFSPFACRPYRAQTKGKVESGIKYVKYNFWPGLHFGDLADLNQQALSWLNTIANGRVHGTTGVTPFSRLGQEGLHPVQPYDTSVLSSRRSSKDCLVSYAGNYYSVPAAYACQALVVKETDSGELLILSAQGELLATHRVLVGRRQRSIQTAHYAGLPVLGARRAPPTAIQDRIMVVPFGNVPPLPQVEIRPLSVYEALAGGDQ
ncbi:MAG: IS21 family transposase [Candidatus Dormibacteraceae bacterium]